MTARQDIAWRAKAHAEGRSTSLDGIPNIGLYLVHLAWRIQSVRRLWYTSR